MRTSKATELRRLLKDRGVIRLIGAHDGLSAKIGERAGFDAVWASGFEISAAYALPDANILTMTEYLGAATVMNDAIRIPVVADCDTGYGNSLNVIQLVRKYEAAGIAAVCLEDKLFPKVNSFVAGRQELASIAEFVGKILAAKNARANPDFMVIARTEALIAGWGMEEALTRARAYVEAGADGILIHSKKKDPGEIEEFVHRWDRNAPLWIVPTSYPSLGLDRIRALGKIGAVIYANQGLRSAAKVMEKNLRKIVETGSAASLEGEMASMEEIFELQGMQELKRNEARFLPAVNGRPSAVILAAGDHRHENLISTVLRETPLILLDIHGQSVLDRDLEILRQQGIQDIRVVTGYRADKVNHSDITKIVNSDYREAGSLQSLMMGLEGVANGAAVIFGDILFEREILRRLLESPQEIVLVVDRAFAARDGRARKAAPDLVRAQFDPVRDPHMIRPERENRVVRVGKEINWDQAHFEFIGMMLLSMRGVEIVRKEYRDVLQQNGSGPFYESPSLAKAGVTDFLQFLIDRRYAIHTFEIYGGWREIHTFADYQAICQSFAQVSGPQEATPQEVS